MAVIKCKMCGGDLVLVEGQSVAECEYCGSRQTVPAADNEKKLTLFARANRLRAGCEFDKAAGVYESIVADFTDESEAYWGLVLCKYGIEYVDDPATGKKIPTCHRSSFDSILEDSDFEQALENADTVARKVYREEAKQIEEIRKGIIEVSGKEEPYDIFICYKETDENGERTLDSVLAQDVYDALTDKGYRVFFSRITLEDKLGQEYEPYIFAALNSAKIMLAFGTDYEYFNAVWVKNEWSRFLKLMEKDKTKHLLPCYKGIDAYDMPREFAKLQAQDMGKVGAMQDLLRGIEKLLSTGRKEEIREKAAIAQSTYGPTVESLLTRGQMFLEDKNWTKAGEYFDKVLDIDPKCAEAYLGKFNSEKKYTSMQEIGMRQASASCFRDTNFEKALKFSSPVLRETIEKHTVAAMKLFESKLAQTKKISSHIACSNKGFLGLKSDGTLEGMFDDCCSMGVVNGAFSWWNLVAVVAGGPVAGLKDDGTVVAAAIPQEDLVEWTDIVELAAGGRHIIGLKSDGTVVATGDDECGQCDISNWKDITAVSAGSSHTVGLKADGTVVAIGTNRDSQCNVSDWTNIVAVAAGDSNTIGLKADGTVVAVGSNAYGECDVSDWENIVAVAAGRKNTIGLKSDGTVVAVGYNKYGTCDVSSWRNIVAVTTGGERTMGLKMDGTVVTAGYNEISPFGKMENEKSTSDWKLFESVETLEQEQAVARKRAKEERMAATKRAEAERIAATKQTEEECITAAKQMEVDKNAEQREELQAQLQAIHTEMDGLKGIFSIKRRRELEVRMGQILLDLDDLDTNNGCSM